MQHVVIGLGALCCVGGAVAHFTRPDRRGEGTFGLACFVLLLAGMYLTRA